MRVMQRHDSSSSSTRSLSSSTLANPLLRVFSGGLQLAADCDLAAGDIRKLFSDTAKTAYRAGVGDGKPSGDSLFVSFGTVTPSTAWPLLKADAVACQGCCQNPGDDRPPGSASAGVEEPNAGAELVNAADDA